MIAGRAGVNASPYDIASDKSKEKKGVKEEKEEEEERREWEIGAIVI